MLKEKKYIKFQKQKIVKKIGEIFLGKSQKQTLSESSKKFWNKILGERIWKTKFKNKFGRKKTLGTKIQKKKI